METTVENTTISNAVTQTDLVSSPILWHCLYVIRTVPEFRNLTYRITKTRNDVEMVVLYREGVLGIFGPPIDPITLTLDPKGKCLLSIPFKPVQRVSIVSAESGQIEISSLLAVLRMIAGKGYLFCPGLPERFLAGKACGKFVVLHKVPFKRYQSAQCTVYYQTQALQEQNNTSSLCALCPRCLHAAKWIQSLPAISPCGAGKAAQQLSQPIDYGQLQRDKKSAILGSSISNNITQELNGCTVPSTCASRLFNQANFDTSSVTSVPNGPQFLNIHLQKPSSLDVNGNNQAADIFKHNNIVSDQCASSDDTKKSSLNTKLLEKRLFLRNLLQERSKKIMGSSDVITDTKDGKSSHEEASKQLNSKLKSGKQRLKNICCHCKKEFSSPASLMNHFQRHEALSGSWHKQLRKQKLLKSYTSSSSLLRMVLRGSKLSPFLQGKKPVHLSETSLRLFLKYLDAIVPSHNGTKSLKQHGYAAAEYKNAINETEKQMEPQRSQPFNLEQTEIEAQEKRSGLKRTSSSLSPMQILLEAAAIAEFDDQNAKSSTTSSLSSSLVLGKQHEAAVVSSTSQSPTFQPDEIESSVPKKKSKKSKKLAFKKVKGKSKIPRDDNLRNEITFTKITATSENSSRLTNLNLLSPVSMQTAMRETPTSNHNSVTVSSCIPTILSPKIQTRSTALPTSDFICCSQHSLKNSPENTFLINGSQGKEPFANISSSADLPPLPPLLYARNMQGSSSAFPLTCQKHQGQPLLQSATPALVRNLTAVSNNQSTISASLVSSVKTEFSSECGAIDLSKPKPSQAAANILSVIDKKPDLTTLTGQLHKITQQVTSNDSPEVLKYLIMLAKSADFCNKAHQEPQPFSATTGNKQANTMIAPAYDYMVDKGVKNSSHIQADIATSTSLTLPEKCEKPVGGSAVQSEEIQCGYKWSGSGGFVKEHTQMVQELVPSHVMASFLSKPWTSPVVTQPINGKALSNTSKPHLSSQQLVLTSKCDQIVSHELQNVSTSQHALNFSRNKPAEVPI